jgi:hypothetical protein
MWVLDSWPKQPVKILGTQCKYCRVTMLQMDEIIAWLPKITNEKFGMLMQVLLGEYTIKHNMKYLYVGIACPKK